MSQPEHPSLPGKTDPLRGRFQVLNWLVTFYLVSLLVWFSLYRFSGDRFAVVSLLTMGVVYAFVPLPLALAWAIKVRRTPGLVFAILDCGVFLVLWGPLFLPGFPKPIQPALSILTYNVLGWNTEVAGQIDTLRKVDADVVFIQELNPQLANLLQTHLASQYPYQVLDAREGVDGMGTLSKYPLSKGNDVPPLDWVGEPQRLRLQWPYCPIDLLNIHMAPTNFFNAEHIHRTNAQRQAQARWIIEQISPSQPFIVGGDTNSVPLSDSYRILRQELEDAWQASGWGLGHTFPGRAGPGSSRPQFFGVAVPQWLLRIDYILYTPHFTALEAHLADFDGISDHRGVWARLGLVAECEPSKP